MSSEKPVEEIPSRLGESAIGSTIGSPGHRWVLVEMPMKLENGEILYLKGWHLEHHVLGVPQG